MAADPQEKLDSGQPREISSDEMAETIRKLEISLSLIAKTLGDIERKLDRLISFAREQLGE